VATHPHADHVTGLPAVLSRFAVGLVVDPGCQAPSPFYDAFLRAVQASRTPFRHPIPGDVLTLGDLRLEVLAPAHCFVGTRSDLNNDSVVFRLTAVEMACCSRATWRSRPRRSSSGTTEPPWTRSC
jgi:competence protein ComEC